MYRPPVLAAIYDAKQKWIVHARTRCTRLSANDSSSSGLMANARARLFTWFVLALIPSIGLKAENTLIPTSFILTRGSFKSAHNCSEKKTTLTIKLKIVTASGVRVITNEKVWNLETKVKGMLKWGHFYLLVTQNVWFQGAFGNSIQSTREVDQLAGFLYFLEKNIVWFFLPGRHKKYEFSQKSEQSHPCSLGNDSASMIPLIARPRTDWTLALKQHDV